MPCRSVSALALVFLLASAAFAQPDLVVTSVVTETSSGDPGEGVTLDFLVSNVGTGTSSGTRIGFYFSSDHTLSGDDVFSEDEGIKILGPGGSEFDTEQIVIPSDAPRGAVFLIAFIDNIEFVPESDETNNTLAVPFTVNGAVDVEDGTGDAALSLGAAFPNPFRTQTSIPFALPTSTHARITVTDALGRHVATLVDGVRPAGTQSVGWTTDVVPGCYLVRLELGDALLTRRLAVVR